MSMSTDWINMHLLCLPTLLELAGFFFLPLAPFWTMHWGLIGPGILGEIIEDNWSVDWAGIGGFPVAGYRLASEHTASTNPLWSLYNFHLSFSYYMDSPFYENNGRLYWVYSIMHTQSKSGGLSLVARPVFPAWGQLAGHCWDTPILQGGVTTQ